MAIESNLSSPVLPRYVLACNVVRSFDNLLITPSYVPPLKDVSYAHGVCVYGKSVYDETNMLSLLSIAICGS